MISIRFAAARKGKESCDLARYILYLFPALDLALPRGNLETVSQSEYGQEEMLLIWTPALRDAIHDNKEKFTYLKLQDGHTQIFKEIEDWLVRKPHTNPCSEISLGN